MRAMILAAGVGERMRPLTEHTPKPLLRVADTPLIEHHLRRLAAAGFTEIVINVAHLGEQIMDYCADGSQWGVTIVYSPEGSPLETAGGIVNALPLLGDKPFLVMVKNPPQHTFGDFQLDGEGWVRSLESGAYGWTYAGLGIYTTAFFAAMPESKMPLRPLLDAAIRRGQLGGERYMGQWQDVGTPDRLQELNNIVKGII